MSSGTMKIRKLKERPEKGPDNARWVTFESKEDRILKHIREFSDEELTELLLNGKTIYGAESELDTDTDIADQMQDELDDRQYLREREQERKANPLWGAFE